MRTIVRVTLAMLSLLCTRLDAATFQVNSTEDESDLIHGDGICATSFKKCTLRAAVQESNFLEGDDAILIPAGIFLLSNTLHGDLDIFRNVRVTGAGPDKSIIEVRGEFRAISISGRATNAQLSGLAIRNGRSAADGGGILVNAGAITLSNCRLESNHALSGSGGALRLGPNASSARIETCVFTDNDAAQGGGLAIEGGDAVLTNVEIVENHARTGNGGGILLQNGSLKLQSGRVRGNVAAGSGAGIAAGAALELEGSVLSGNRSEGIDGPSESRGNGGGLWQLAGRSSVRSTLIQGNNASSAGGGLFVSRGATVKLHDSTVSGNIADKSGGGISSAGLAQVLSCTVAFNGSDRGGNLDSVAWAIDDGASSTPDAAILLHSSIVSDPTDGGNCAGTVGSAGHNLVSDATCGVTADGDQVGAEARLAPLNDNGGDTLTHAVSGGSPAIDAGDNAVCGARDQRGLARPQRRTCDVGAFEAGAPVQLHIKLEGTGQVTADVAGVSCPAVCDRPFDQGSRVTLSATAPVGMYFAGWAGPCKGVEACSVEMDGDVSVVARFAPVARHRIVATVLGKGSLFSDPPLLDCPYGCDAQVPGGTRVRVFAEPEAGWRFVGWAGMCSGTGPCVLDVSDRGVIGARFVEAETPESP